MHAQTLTSDALAPLSRLDELEPLEALQALSAARAWLLVNSEQQMLRARAHRFSWRDIAGASGVTMSTVRRWVDAGLPDQTRRRS